MIHDKVCESRKLNSVSYEAESLWFRILSCVDDNGNYYRDSRRVFPAMVLEKKGSTEESTEKALKELVKIDLIKEFESDGRKYLHIVDFEKYQDLRADGYATVQYPIHPPELGQGYTSEGRRSTVLRESEEPKKVVKDRFESGNGAVVERLGASHPVPKNTTKSGSSIEVEVEVKDKREIETKESVSQSVEDSLESKKQNPGWPAFKKEFREWTGVRLSDRFTNVIKQYDEAVDRYGWEMMCKAMEAWRNEEGGREVTKKNKWASKNFFEALEDVIEELKRHPESVEKTNDPYHEVNKIKPTSIKISEENMR